EEKSDFAYVRSMKGRIDGPRGLPLVKPPWGRLTAIDLKSGEHLWRVPLGTGPRDHPALKDVKDLPEQLGSPQRGHVLCTKSLLFAGQEGNVEKIIGLIRDGKGSEAAKIKLATDAKLRALDKKTGRQLAAIPLPDNMTGAPMTYVVGKKQFIVFPVGGLLNPDELVALSLPD